MYSNISHTNLKSKKMGDDLGTGKTVFILVIVVGCFAILCPNVFYPMLFGSPQNRIKPSPIDRTTGLFISYIIFTNCHKIFWIN